MDTAIGIAICDDEPVIHDTVAAMIERYSQNLTEKYRLVHFFTAEELLAAEEEIHILFLDIEMPGMDGIEAAARLKKAGKAYKIIMLTGKPERFKEAFKIGAYRFVTKPVEFDELTEALEDTVRTIAGYTPVSLRYHNVVCEIPQRELDYIEACGDYVRIYAKERVFESDLPLKYWEQELDGRLFTACHKSYIVNLGCVEEVGKDLLRLRGDREIPLARRRKKEVMQQFVAYDLKQY